MIPKKLKIIHGFALIIIIVLIGGSFYGGVFYGKSQNARPGFGNESFQTRINRTGSNGSSFISGNIISKDANSITLQIPNNGSKIIFYSDTTQINKFAAGTADDLLAGTSVSITGTTNSDGSITGQSIQIRPQGSNLPNQKQ